MANPWQGEVVLTIDGQPQTMRLTLGALAALEAELELGSLFALIERFESGQFGAADILAVLRAGLIGGRSQVDPSALESAQIEGGPLAAARAAAQLIAVSFAAPAQTSDRAEQGQTK